MSNEVEETQDRVCIVCKHEILPDERFVPVMTNVGGALVHRNCHDAWVSMNR